MVFFLFTFTIADEGNAIRDRINLGVYLRIGKFVRARGSLFKIRV